MTKDFEQIRYTHDTFLTKIQYQSFILNKVVLACLNDIMGSCLQFCSMVNSLVEKQAFQISDSIETVIKVDSSVFFLFLIQICFRLKTLLSFIYFFFSYSCSNFIRIEAISKSDPHAFGHVQVAGKEAARLASGTALDQTQFQQLLGRKERIFLVESFFIFFCSKRLLKNRLYSLIIIQVFFTIYYLTVRQN